jgi:hypothetical protein
MEIELHEANQVPVNEETDQVESGSDKKVVIIYKDAALLRAHMQDIASEKGARRGKLLKHHKDFPRGGNRIVKRCINSECNFQMMARKCARGCTIDEEWSETHHYTLSHNGLRGVCSNRAMATMVRAIIYIVFGIIT